jgi:hypothetical protein
MKTRAAALVFFFAILMASLAICQTAGPARSSEPTTRTIRSVSGTRGSEQGGRFFIEDPKNVFHLPGDKKVIVYFEWEGRPGSHHFEGQWKNPEGKMVVMSDFKFDTKDRRFGAYWELLLSEGMATGMWALEALVDGQPAGTHTFRIIQAPGSAPAEEVRRPLTPGQIYDRARAGLVKVESMDQSGEVQSVGSGFFIADGALLTAFQVLDGAARLRVTYPGGEEAGLAEVSAYDRWQDWAILPLPARNAAVLAPASKPAWSVGDRMFTLVPSGPEGAHVIRDLNITGVSKHGQAGERISLNEGLPRAAMGAPLLDEFGEVIGFLGGVLFPGAASAHDRTGGVEITAALRVGSTGTAVPIQMVRTEASGRHTFSDLLARGHFVPPLSKEKVVFRGSLSGGIDNRSPGFPQAEKEGFEFSRQPGKIYLLVFWEQDDKRRKAERSFRIYDLENRLLSQSKPGKIDLRRGGVANTVWELSIAKWPVGIYRVDVVLDGAPVWRGFLKVTD